MMIKEGSTKLVNFMNPASGVLVLRQICHKVRKLNFFKIRQTKYITMMNKEGSTKTINFMTLRIWFLY